MTATTFRARLFSRLVIDPSGCLLWQGALSGGYGVIRVSGRLHRAHRLMYEIFVGPVPAGMELDHLCGTPSCASPAHLEAVSHKVNMARGLTGTQERCRLGHEFDLVNTYWRPDGKGRQCRACNYERGKRRRRDGVCPFCGGMFVQIARHVQWAHSDACYAESEDTP